VLFGSDLGRRGGSGSHPTHRGQLTSKVVDHETAPLAPWVPRGDGMRRQIGRRRPQGCQGARGSASLDRGEQQAFRDALIGLVAAHHSFTR